MYVSFYQLYSYYYTWKHKTKYIFENALSRQRSLIETNNLTTIIGGTGTKRKNLNSKK